MAVFALNNGKLVTAPAFHDSDNEASAEALAAVRDSALELIDRPLFSVGWVTGDARDNHQQSLIALDSSGQVVTIDVIDELTARGLIAAAARAGRHSEYTRRQLVDIHAHGTNEFLAEWNQFLDLTPPVAGKGPRLYLFVAHLADDAREPLLALMGVGVEAQQIIMHSGANGILVELADIARQRPHFLHASGNVARLDGTAVASERAERSNATPAASVDATEWKMDGWGATPKLPEMTHGIPPQKHEPIEVPSQYRRDLPETSAPASRTAAVPVDEPRRDTAIMLAELSAQAEVARPSTPQQPAPQQPTRSASDAAVPRRRRSHRRHVPEVATPVPQASAPQTPRVSVPQAPAQPPVVPQTPVRQTPVVAPRTRIPSALSADIPVDRSFAPITGRTLYDDVLDSAKPAEQRLWEKSAPASAPHMLISESDSAAAAARAVAEAARRDVRRGSPRLAEAARRAGGYVAISWVSPRRGIDLHATLTPDGFIDMPNGARFTDPGVAACSKAEIGRLDPWQGWRTKSGTPLGEL